MPTLNVHIKHGGKNYPLALDTDVPGLAFKEKVYQATGVPVERMKVMVKGGILKDDSTWAKFAPKEGQTFMVVGAAGDLPKAPEKKTIFVEDMDDEDLAQALVIPNGLKNMGNTCYMNATVQALRAVPELLPALEAGAGSSLLPRSLRDLYTTMGHTTDSVNPMAFISSLRQAHPQFGEVSRAGRSSMAAQLGMGAGYAQQDAEECYGVIINSMRDIPVPGSTDINSKFIEQYMMTETRREMKTLEAPAEEPTIQLEKISKLQCMINISTNFMAQGIENSLTGTIEKVSPTLGRTAVYTQTTRLTRLPAYLTVHMVRFAWRADVGPNGGKAKIMRRVKFPTTYDALGIVTPELKAKLLPVSQKLQEIEKERADRRKVRKRTKGASTSTITAAPVADTDDTNPAPAEISVDLEPEEVYKKREVKTLTELVPTSVINDIGSSWSGVYELIAIVTHKGAAADAGHYIGFAKKSAFAPRAPVSLDGDVAMSDSTASSIAAFNPNLTALPGAEAEDADDWYKFDDEKVSVFPKEKLPSLEGGGEDASAYVLLYRTKSF